MQPSAADASLTAAQRARGRWSAPERQSSVDLNEKINSGGTAVDLLVKFPLQAICALPAQQS